MTKKQMQKYADICEADAMISLGHCEANHLNGSILLIEEHKKAANTSIQRWENSRNAWEFELMNSLSHRQFCQLMGY